MRKKENTVLFTKNLLVQEYSQKKMSAKQIAQKYGCSENKVNYWLGKFFIKKRSISDSVLVKRPDLNEFSVNDLRTVEDGILFGLGLGLYWGEGTKRDAMLTRIGNSDPALLIAFMNFMQWRYGIKQSRYRVGLHLHDDCSVNEMKKYWSQVLQIPTKQFYKPYVLPKRAKGTYKHLESKGVATLYISGKKLRDHLNQEIEKLQKKYILGKQSK